MRFALNAPNFGIFADPRLTAELAHEAEESGWDGFFLWDHIGGALEWDVPMADPWMLMAAMATRTSRITLGPIVTPLPRRRPWKVAREAVTMDHLSGGRFVLGVGIGLDIGGEYSLYGEPPDDRLHAEQLDESLEIITRLWSGEAMSFAGKHYQLKDVRHQPTPVQQPRLPIWVAGVWPHRRPFRRAAQWDGVCPIGPTEDPLTLADYQGIVDAMRTYRQDDRPFDVTGASPIDGTDLHAEYEKLLPFAEAGVTWWQSGLWSIPLDEARARIRRGPPRP